MITYYGDKEEALTAEEFDENFRDLDDRLRAFQDLGIQATGLANLVVDEATGTLLFSLTDGTTYGPFNLPVGFFVPRNAWASGLQYRLRDYVTVGGSSYACLAAHVSGVFADDLLAGKWMVVALKGEAGKDAEPFMTIRGIYSQALSYVAGDGVFRLSGSQYILYRATTTVPAGAQPGTFQPGSPLPYWTPQSLPLPSVEHGGYVPGTFTSGQLLYRRKLARGQSFPEGLTGTVAALATAPAQAFTISLYRNGTKFGALSWAAGSLTPTLSGTATVFVAGDVLTVVAPTTADSAAAGLDLGIVATLT